MTKNETKRKRLEEIVKRVFNVFCYVVTTLAIAIGIAVGVTKCSGSAATETVAADPAERRMPSNSLVTRRNAIDPTDYFVYISRYWGDISIDFDSLRNEYSVPTSVTAVQRSTLSRYYEVSGYAFVDSTVMDLSLFAFVWEDLRVASGVPQYEYKLTRVVAFFGDGTNARIYVRNNEYASGDDTGTFSRLKVVFTEGDIDDTGFLTFFKQAEKSTFTFNEAFNYNAPFNGSVNAVFGATVFDGAGQDISWKDISVGWFYSNGRVFDTIRWYAQSLARGGALLIDGVPTAVTRADMYFYTTMYYRNSTTSEEILVNFRDSLPYNGGDNVYYSNSTTWVVPAYRNIVLLSELSDSTRDKLEAFNNNNQSSYGGGMVSGEVNDIFSLIGGAFTAWIPVLSMYILPNITIGTLLFVPLVALLVFAIIRIIKK